MLTESASASLATPLYVHPEQLRGGKRGLPEYDAQSNMPNPWPCGWWRLRDIVEQQKIAAWAIQDLAARNKETVLWNGYLKSRRQMQRGANGSPKAYVIPAAQHDPLTMKKMINTLLQSDIEIQQADADFSVEGRNYKAGSYIVSLAQPKMGLVRNLLGRTLYPDNDWTRDRDGTPLRPYDTATHTMAEVMGVRVDAIDTPVDDLRRVKDPLPLSGTISAESELYVLDGNLNASFKAANLLLDEGVSVRRVYENSPGLEQGDFVIVDDPVLPAVAELTGVDFRALSSAPDDGSRVLRRKRVGMFQRYRGGNMDEGWTRFVLEQFSFPYVSLKDSDIKQGRLRSKYDVIILPHDSTAMITGEEEDQAPDEPPPDYPPQYLSGLGEEGAEALRQFVEEGGTIVALGDASEFAIENFDLRVRNVLQDLDSKDFYSPGSTLKVRFENSHPLAYGMPDDGLILFWSNAAFEVLESRRNDKYSTVARYIDRDILQSGWLIGEQHLAKKAAMVTAQVGGGQVVLYGFRPQHRAQTHGTFKLFFNTLMN